MVPKVAYPLQLGARLAIANNMQENVMISACVKLSADMANEKW